MGRSTKLCSLLSAAQQPRRGTGSTSCSALSATTGERRRRATTSRTCSTLATTRGSIAMMALFNPLLRSLFLHPRPHPPHTFSSTGGVTLWQEERGERREIELYTCFISLPFISINDFLLGLK